MTVVWHLTAPWSELDYRCDLCGAEASTVHFVPWITRCAEVLFACPKHDPGGYWLELEQLWNENDPVLDEHIALKPGGAEALVLLDDRIEELRRVGPAPRGSAS